MKPTSELLKMKKSSLASYLTEHANNDYYMIDSFMGKKRLFERTDKDFSIQDIKNCALTRGMMVVKPYKGLSHPVNFEVLKLINKIKEIIPNSKIDIVYFNSSSVMLEDDLMLSIKQGSNELLLGDDYSIINGDYTIIDQLLACKELWVEKDDKPLAELLDFYDFSVYEKFRRYCDCSIKAAKGKIVGLDCKIKDFSSNNDEIVIKGLENAIKKLNKNILIKFSFLKNLESLKVDDYIGTIDFKSLSYFKKLKNFEISCIEPVINEDGAILGEDFLFMKLKYLDEGFDESLGLETSIFHNLKSLKLINYQEEIDFKTLSLFESLAELELIDYNSKINGLEQLKGLKKLVIKNSAITQLPLSINKISGLEHLEIENTRLLYLPEAVNELNELKTLIIKNNQLTALPLISNSLSELVIEEESIDEYYLEQNNLRVDES